MRQLTITQTDDHRWLIELKDYNNLSTNRIIHDQYVNSQWFWNQDQRFYFNNNLKRIGIGELVSLLNTADNIIAHHKLTSKSIMGIDSAIAQAYKHVIGRPLV